MTLDAKLKKILAVILVVSIYEYYSTKIYFNKLRRMFKI